MFRTEEEQDRTKCGFAKKTRSGRDGAFSSASSFFPRSWVVHTRSGAKQGTAVVAECGMHDQLRRLRPATSRRPLHVSRHLRLRDSQFPAMQLPRPLHPRIGLRVASIATPFCRSPHMTARDAPLRELRNGRAPCSLARSADEWTA
jgi:hypothetical protein